MNWGLVLWVAALAALIWSCFSMLLGVSLLVLAASGLLGWGFALVGAFMLLKGVASFYYLYGWFTKEVDEE